jgi:hypothetical protein
VLLRLSKVDDAMTAWGESVRPTFGHGPYLSSSERAREGSARGCPCHSRVLFHGSHTHTHTRKSPQVEIFTAIGEKSLDVAKAYNNMATVEEERGNDLAALALHKKALEIKCV